MANFNRIIILGNLVRDPEIRRVQGGAAVARFTIAVNRGTKQNESADYIDVIAWDKLAETSISHLKKGMPVLVEGRLSIRRYESKTGEKRKAVQVVAAFMQILGTASNPNDRQQGLEVEDDHQSWPDVRYRLA
jgi:single-strand DNA-binding protein